MSEGYNRIKKAKMRVVRQEYAKHVASIMQLFSAAGYPSLDSSFANMREAFYNFTKDIRIRSFSSSVDGEFYILNWYRDNRRILCKRYGIKVPGIDDSISFKKQRDVIKPQKVQKIRRSKNTKVTSNGKDPFYKSEAWRKLRYRALSLYGNACQCCGATTASSGSPLHVDHIKPRSFYKSLELDINNLQILCEDCNLGKSNEDATDWRKVGN